MKIFDNEANHHPATYPIAGKKGDNNYISDQDES